MLSLRTRAQADELAGIRRALLAYCAALELSGHLASAVVVATNEACTAAILQADTENAEHALELRAWIGQPGFMHADRSRLPADSGAADRALYVSVRDGSQAIPGRTRADALGARFMRALAEHVRVIEHGRFGTEIILEFRLGTRPA